MNQYTTQNQNQMNMGQGGGQGGMRLGAHEFLETQEALRSKTAEIEMFGLFAAQARDPPQPQLKEQLHRRKMKGYQTLVGMMNAQGQGMNAQMMNPQMQQQMQQMGQMNMNNQARIGLNNPQMPQPNPNASTMSDFSIATIALNWHKMGSVTAMMWANECANPQLRMFHVNAANNCQQMAFECFQFLNAMGLYQVPQLADHTMQTMMGMMR